MGREFAPANAVGKPAIFAFTSFPAQNFGDSDFHGRTRRLPKLRVFETTLEIGMRVVEERSRAIDLIHKFQLSVRRVIALLRQSRQGCLVPLGEREVIQVANSRIDWISRQVFNHEVRANAST